MRAKIKEIKKQLETAKKHHDESMQDNISEESQDVAYQLYYHHIELAAGLIREVTRNQIDHITAMRMAIHNPDKIIGLITHMN